MSESTENNEKVANQAENQDEKSEPDPVTEMGYIDLDQTNMVTDDADKEKNETNNSLVVKEKIQIKSSQEMYAELPGELKSSKPTILNRLFSGSAIYNAKVTINDIENDCVIKVFSEPNDVRRQLRRFISSQKLNNTHLVKIKRVYLQMDGEASKLYLIMDRFEKCLRSALLNSQQVPQEDKTKPITSKTRDLQILQQINYALQIAEGLSYLHSHNPPIFHGNLRPDHVLIIGDEAKLCGMRFMDPDDTTDQTATKTSTNAGKDDGYRYDGPEYYNFPRDGKTKFEYTTQFDVYSAGVIFFWLVTGTMAWKCATVVQMTSEHLRDKLHPQEGCPEWLFELCKECIDPDPAKRPKDGAAILARILAGIKKDSTAIVAKIPEEGEKPKDDAQAAKCN